MSLVARGILAPINSRCSSDLSHLTREIRVCFQSIRFLFAEETGRSISLAPSPYATMLQYSDAAWELEDGRFVAAAGGIVIGRGHRLAFSGAVPPSFLSSLQPRRTQIFPCELWALIATSMSSLHALRGQRVIMFCDNIGVACSIASGKCYAIDLLRILHAFYKRMRQERITWWVEWIPSSQNPADPLSRNVKYFGETLAEPFVEFCPSVGFE